MKWGEKMSKNAINNIDLEIKKLKEKKKELIAKREREIGAYLLKVWNIEDKTTEAIFKLIDEHKPNNNNIKSINDKNNHNKSINNIKNGDKNEQNRQAGFKNQTSGREEKSSK